MNNKIRSNSEKNTKLIFSKKNNSMLGNTRSNNSETIPDHLKEYVNLNHSILFVPLD